MNARLSALLIAIFLLTGILMAEARSDVPNDFFRQILEGVAENQKTYNELFGDWVPEGLKSNTLLKWQDMKKNKKTQALPAHYQSRTNRNSDFE